MLVSDCPCSPSNKSVGPLHQILLVNQASPYSWSRPPRLSIEDSLGNAHIKFSPTLLPAPAWRWTDSQDTGDPYNAQPFLPHQSLLPSWIPGNWFLQLSSYYLPSDTHGWSKLLCCFTALACSAHLILSHMCFSCFTSWNASSPDVGTVLPLQNLRKCQEKSLFALIEHRS